MTEGKLEKIAPFNSRTAKLALKTCNLCSFVAATYILHLHAPVGSIHWHGVFSQQDKMGL